MNASGKWDEEDETISDTRRMLIESLRYDDPYRGLIAKSDDLNKQISAMGQAIINAGKITANKLPPIVASQATQNSGGILGAWDENNSHEKKAIWNTRNKVNDLQLPTSSHVSNRIIDNLKLPRYTDSLSIRSVTIYEDPSQEKNKVYYLAVNGGHRVAVFNSGQRILEILDMKVCSNAVPVVGIFRLNSYKDRNKYEYSCNTVAWNKFVQIISKAITYSELPTQGHKYVSNEFAEGTAPEETFEYEYPAVPENGEVLALINHPVKEGKSASFNVYRNINGKSVRETLLWMRYSQNNSVRAYVWMNAIRNFGPEVYDEAMRYLRNLGIPNDHDGQRVEFEVRDSIINTPLGFAEQFMNIVAGYNQYRADYATDYAYLVYRNKIRNKS